MIIKRSSNFNFEANLLENTYLENWSSRNLSFPHFEILYIFTRRKKNDLDTIYHPETGIERKKINFINASGMEENSR